MSPFPFRPVPMIDASRMTRFRFSWAKPRLHDRIDAANAREMAKSRSGSHGGTEAQAAPTELAVTNVSRWDFRRRPEGPGRLKIMAIDRYIKGVKLRTAMCIVAVAAAVFWVNHLRKRSAVCNELIGCCEQHENAHLEVAEIADEASAIARKRSEDFAREGDPESANRNRLMADWFTAEADLARHKVSVIRGDRARLRRSLYMILGAIPHVGPWSPAARIAGDPTVNRLVDHQSSLPLETLGPWPIPRPTLPAEFRSPKPNTYIMLDQLTALAESRNFKDDKYESKLPRWERLQAEVGLRAPWFVQMERVFADLESKTRLKASARTEVERFGNLRDSEVEAFEKYSDLVDEAISEDALRRAYEKALRQESGD
jgi:hypothetical protein